RDHARDRGRGARAARGRRGGAGARRPRPARGDRAQVRRGAGGSVDAGRRPRRGAGHGRGRVRALPPAARVPPADAARADRHRPRTRPRRGRTGGAGRLPLLVSNLWVPGFAGPLDDLVDRIHRRIELFADDAGVEQAYVEVVLVDGARYAIESLDPAPGYGFVTIRPHPGEDVPGEVIVPIGSIRRIELSRAAEQRAALGFSVPAG